MARFMELLYSWSSGVVWCTVLCACGSLPCEGAVVTRSGMHVRAHHAS